MKSLISIVAPAYNEEDVIEKFYLRITKILSALSEYNYEICIVNDGSEDNTVKYVIDYWTMTRIYLF